jgi:hypothetical protein
VFSREKNQLNFGYKPEYCKIAILAGHFREQNSKVLIFNDRISGDF